MTTRILLAIALCCLPVAASPALAQPLAPLTTAEAVAANNDMALKLYGEMNTGQENLFFSPVSISLSLAMALAGAHGETATEIAQALGLNPEMATDVVSLGAAYGDLLTQLNPADAQCVLRVVNRLWAQQGLSLRQDYTNLLTSEFKSSLQKMNFQGDPEGSRRIINGWVAQQTENLIQDLIPSGVLNKDTQLILTNAIYFLGDWAAEFEQDSTHDRPFHVAKEHNLSVPTMAQYHSFQYARIDDGQLLVLPYKRNELEMVILLPDAVDGLAALESKLTANSLATWLGATSSVPTDLHLPRFRIAGEFSLKHVLQELGIGKAFSREADFSGMTAAESLFIADVVHKSFVNVFEEGTEAAAATAVLMERMSAINVGQEHAVFHADHPFMFLIRHQATGAVLFMGRVTDPS